MSSCTTRLRAKAAFLVAVQQGGFSGLRGRVPEEPAALRCVLKKSEQN